MIGFMMPMFGRTLVYFVTYVLDRPSLMRDVLLALNAGQIGGVLLWTGLVQRWGKPMLLLNSFLVSLVGLVLLAFLASCEAALLPAAALLGMGLAGVYMLPWGIVADVVDFAEFRHGDRREVPTFGAFLLLVKGSSALATAFIGTTLEVSGYSAGSEQNVTVRAAILWLSFGIPIAGSIAGALLVSRLTLGHALHTRILTALARKRRPN